MLALNTRMDGKVVDTLCCLLFQRFQDDFWRQLFDPPSNDHGIDRNGADRNSAVPNDRLAAGIQIASRRKVHDRIRSPPLGPLELFDFFIGAGGNGRRPHVGVDLGLGGTTNRHRVEFVFQMNLICGNHHPPGSHFIPDLFRGEVRFSLGNARHFGCHNAQASKFQLRHRFKPRRRFPGSSLFIRLLPRFRPKSRS